MTFGLAFLAGLLVMPALVYLAGRYTLGPYAHGTVQETHGVFSLFADFFKGLVEPRPSCWIVLLGPFAFLTFVRLCRLVLRKA